MSCRFSAMLHIPGDVRNAIAFYERAFGAVKGWSTPPASDMVAQLLVQDAEFWVHPAGEEIDNLSPAQLGGTAVRLMLIVDDPDAVFDQAVAAGAVVRSPMQDRDYGWRDGSIVDPSGHRWRSVSRYDIPLRRTHSLWLLRFDETIAAEKRIPFRNDKEKTGSSPSIYKVAAPGHFLLI